MTSRRGGPKPGGGTSDRAGRRHVGLRHAVRTPRVLCRGEAGTGPRRGVFASGVRTAKFPVAYRGTLPPGAVAVYRFRRGDGKILAYWNCASHPDNANRPSEATFVADAGSEFSSPVLVDAVTGAIYEVGPGAIGNTRDGKTSYALPIYDSPLLLMDGGIATRK